MNPSQLINQTSSEVEYYTDPKILEAAREVLGVIELDPASSARANESVRAKTWFGFDPVGMFVDGIYQKWSGNIWLNHPFGRKEKACGEFCAKKHKHHSIDYHGNKAWVNKLVMECNSLRVSQALCITYACTSEAWFQPLLTYPQCFLSPRTNYYTPDGKVKKGVTKGSVVTYIGPDVQRFVKFFRRFGKIKAEI